MVFFCIVCLLWALWTSLFQGFSLATGNGCLLLFGRHFWDNYACARDGFYTKRPETARERVYTNVNLGTVPPLPMPRLPPGGSLGTPNILGTGATFHLGPLRLHVENLECRAQKWSARCQKCAVPCRFFCACKWGFSV